MIEATVDTASNAPLTLPTDLIRELGLQPIRAHKSTVADGSEVESCVYVVPAFIRNEVTEVEVVELDCDPLLGMPLMQGCRLLIDIVPGGDVTIEPLEIPHVQD